MYFLEQPCGLWFGSCLILILFLVLYYILFAFLIRARGGEKVWLHASFWFYLSSAIFVTILIPLYSQWNSLCQFTCYTFMLSHCAMRVSTVAFIFFKLELFNPERITHSKTSITTSSHVEKFCYGVCALYILLLVVRSITRLWSKCYPCGLPNSCILEVDPGFFTAHIPDTLFTICEILLFFRLIISAKAFYSDHEFINENSWFETEVVSRMWWYAGTSFVTLTTNFFLYATYTIIEGNAFGIFGYFSFCKWVFFLNAGSVNLAINVLMVTLCFPFRSLSVYHLWNAPGFPEFHEIATELTPEIATELTPETLRELMALEKEHSGRSKKDTMNDANRKVELRKIKRNLQPGQRLISKNWERDPVTGIIRILPSQSPSPSKSPTKDSSSGVLLMIPGHPHDVNVAGHVEQQLIE